MQAHSSEPKGFPDNVLTQTLSWCQSRQAASIKARGQFPCQRVPSEVQAGPKTEIRRYIHHLNDTKSIHDFHEFFNMIVSSG